MEGGEDKEESESAQVQTSKSAAQKRPRPKVGITAETIEDAIAEGLRARKDKKAPIDAVHEMLKKAFSKSWKDLSFGGKPKKLGQFVSSSCKSLNYANGAISLS